MEGEREGEREVEREGEREGEREEKTLPNLHVRSGVSISPGPAIVSPADHCQG